MKDDKYSEREVVNILGGKLKKDSKKSITSMIMVLVFAFALISPFASSLAAKIYVKEKSTVETISTTITKETTEKTVDSTTVVKTTSPTTTTAIRTTNSPVTTTAPTTEEETVPTRRMETTTQPTTKPEPITRRATVKQTSTQNVTTEAVIPEVKVTPVNNGDSVTMLVETYPDGGELSLVCSSSRNAVRVEGNTIIPQNEGGALIAVYYTYNGWRVGDTLCVTVGIKWGETYKTERQEETNSLKVLVSQKEEYQLYRWVCDSCRFRDCYTETKTTCCKDSYPQGTCSGKFTILETKWFSDIKPNELQSHSFSGIKSVLGADSKEWYWIGSSQNISRTIYEYRSGTYYIENIT